VVELNVRKAEFMVGSKQNHLSGGTAVTITDIYTKFMLREAGYRLKAFVSDLRIDLFTKDLTTGQI
jgi:hypothetical protein